MGTVMELMQEYHKIKFPLDYAAVSFLLDNS